jgi:undecaprenyl-diphosphatase
MGFFEYLNHLDHELFTIINGKGNVPALNTLMLLLRNHFTWIPVYAFILYLSVFKFRKDMWLFIGLFLITFGITDYLTVEVLRPLIHRPRPCHDESLQATINLLMECGGPNGLPSAHASNHFGMSMFCFVAFNSIFKKKYYILFFWAFLVCYAQVYVGKHFPGDVMLGALIGITAGAITGNIFRYYYKKKNNKPLQG